MPSSDARSYFDRVEQLLRRSVGVSEAAKVREEAVRPAPAVDDTPLAERDEDDFDNDDDDSTTTGKPADPIFDAPDGGGKWQDWNELKKKLEAENPASGGHDEL